LAETCEEPLKQMVYNAGHDPEVILKEVKKRNQNIKNTASFIGFDVKTNQYVEMLKAGIIDPVKVVRLALENAVSAASTLLTTEAAVAEKEEKKEGNDQMPSMEM
jgi:chaperonin GroEL